MFAIGRVEAGDRREGADMKSIHRSILARSLMAGASLLAIVLGSGDANAVVFGGPGGGYTIPTTGYYDFRVAGADGGGGNGFGLGGIGAVVGGELFLDAGEAVEFVVGGAGRSAFNYGGGGGGGSFVFRGDSYLSGGLLFAAGGGGGSFFDASGGSPGIGYGGHPAGPASYGGGGGSGTPFPSLFPGGPPAEPAQPGSFPFGGAGACCSFVGQVGGGPVYAQGGYGGGGGGGYNGGGGGGGAPGGSGGSGGSSYVIDTARNAFGITGGNMTSDFGNGYVSINFVAAPEPSTWAMTLTGFAGLGWLARLRRRKLTPA
jgi:hypothetical protein